MAVDKNTILANAQKYTARGQIDKAIEEWQKLIRETPNDANIYNTIGDLYLRNNSIQEAVSAYLKAGDTFYKAGFALKTIALYKKVNKIDPENIEVFLRLGALNAERGLIGNARDDYLKAARIYLKQGQNKQAVAVYKKIADLEPENISVHQKIAEMCVKEGLKKDAAEQFIKIADVHLKNNEVKEAEDFYNKALSIEPGNRKAELGIGNLRFKQDKLQDGIGILEGILEKRPDDINTLILFVDACFKSGDYLKAEKNLKHLITLEPNNPAHHERLGYVYLKKGKFSDAISEFRSITDNYIQNNEYDKLKKIAQDVLEADHKNIDAHTMLIDVYGKTGNEGGKITEYLAIADIYAEQSLLEKAANIYKEVLSIDPNNMEAKSRLEAITVKEPPQKMPPKEEPQIKKPPKAAVEPIIEAPPAFKPEVEEKAFSDEDAEKIEGYFTEADVYLKYGLTNKSVEQLELILSIQPHELKAHKKLKDIYKIDGNIPRAVDACITIANIYKEKGDIKKAEAALKEAVEIDPQNERAINRLNELTGAPSVKGEASAPAAEPVLETGAAPTVDLSEFDLEGISSIISSGKAEDDVAVLAEGIKDASQDIPVINVGKEPEPVSEPIPEKFEKAASEIPVFEPVDIQPEVLPEPEAEEPAAYSVESENIHEIIAEADFYAQQGLVPEAQAIYERILSVQPDNKEIKEKLDKLFSGAKKEKKPPPVIEKKEVKRPPEKASPTAFKVYERDEKAEEGGFFDLSEELEEEMSSAPAGAPPKELKDMELDDIFTEFKKGVKEFLGDEDHETHYNLGIAYKEMGLINEAIGEFQLAIKGAERFFDASSMLALCFKEKGMHQLAINQLKRAIDDPRYNEAELLALKYDLGVIYEEMGQTDEAYNAFMDVYAMDVNFRDVAQKIEKVKKGGNAPAKPKGQVMDKRPVEKTEVSENKEKKIITTKVEDARPVVRDKVEAGAGADAKKNKKGKISYI